MQNEYHVTIRLDEALYAQLTAWSTTGQPVAAIVRHALIDYLARQPDAPTSPAAVAMRLAAMAARLGALEGQVEALTARLDILAASGPPAAASQQPPPTDTSASIRPPVADMAADTPPAPPPGVRRGTMRARILALLQDHPEGLTAEDLRFYLKPERPLGDTLQGMVRQGLLVRQGDRTGGHYLVAETR